MWELNKIEISDAFRAFCEPFDVNAHHSTAFGIIIYIVISFNRKLLEVLWSVLEELVVRAFAENSSVSGEIWFEFRLVRVLIHSVVGIKEIN